MNDLTIKFGTAFIAGTVATAGLVQLVHLLPLPSYIKNILAVVVPVPSIAIALTLLYFGPGAQGGGASAGTCGTPGELLKMFLFGSLAAFGYNGAAMLWRMFQPFHHDNGEE